MPFVWAAIWAIISAMWVRRDLWKEAEEWELDKGELAMDKRGSEP